MATSGRLSPFSEPIWIPAVALSGNVAEIANALAAISQDHPEARGHCEQWVAWGRGCPKTVIVNVAGGKTGEPAHPGIVVLGDSAP